MQSISPTLLLTILFLLIVGFCFIGFIRRLIFWLQGQPSRVDIIYGLLAIPKRYFVDVHDVVMRDRRAANMHIALAGGLLSSLIVFILIYFLGFQINVLYCLLYLCLIAACFGLLLLFKRRRSPAIHLSRGGFQRLPYSLFALISGIILFTLDFNSSKDQWDWFNAVALILISLGLTELLVMSFFDGPLKHIFTGALHLAFHPRPERFNDPEKTTALKPLDLNASLGVEKPADFAWNRLLSFDACVQCGRCEKACPAFAAGQPLNPKKLIQDMVIGFSNTADDSQYKGNTHPGQLTGEAKGAIDTAITEGLLSTDTIWSCTTCRACVYECPMLIEHVDTIIDLRRHLTLEKGNVPDKAADALEELRATDNLSGHEASSRIDWAVDLSLPMIRDVKQVDVLVWLGEGGFNRPNQRTLRAIFTLLKKAKVDFAILGEEELDCGDLARRLGDEATFQSLAKRNITILNHYTFNLILTSDPHVLHCLKNEYPDFGGDYNVMHHTTYLNQLAKSNRLAFHLESEQTMTYHDPCYLGRYNNEFDAPRELLRSASINLLEMERSEYRSRCCGWGGGSAYSDIKGEQRIPDMRMQDVAKTNAESVVVACPNCKVMLEGVVGVQTNVKDVAEVLLDALSS